MRIELLLLFVLLILVEHHTKWHMNQIGFYMQALDSEAVHPQISVNVCFNEEESGSIENDIVGAILRAFALKEKMGGSQGDMMDIVTYGHDLYCKGDSDLLARWPKTWAACMKVLSDAGYKEPDTYYVCLT